MKLSEFDALNIVEQDRIVQNQSEFDNMSEEELLSELEKRMMSFKQEPFVRDYPKISRNAPCPCGSGKKYKHCCLDIINEERYKNRDE